MKRCILAIDSSKAICFLLHTVLGRKYKVITVTNGYSALYSLSKRDLPDIIIADPQLPDTEDWELPAYLRSSDLYGNIPIIALSALDGEEMRQKCEELGIVEYFPQPFDPIELVAAVDRMIADPLRRSTRNNVHHLFPPEPAGDRLDQSVTG